MPQETARSAGHTPVAASPAAVQPFVSPPRAAVEELLKSWLDLSELDRRAFAAMARELTDTSAEIERSTLDLSARFQTLAENARSQMVRVEQVIDATQTINVEGAGMSLAQATGFIETVLLKVIDTVLTVSKNAMRMVYSLDDVTREVKSASSCLVQLRAINQQTRFLALNAAIEAAHAGVQSGPFEVIASEIGELSKITDQTTGDVGARIESITRTLGRTHEVLRDIATVDMSEHILAKERLDALLAGMLAQNTAFGAILKETASASADLSGTIAPLVMGLQFQDRAAQHLAHVIEALGTLGQAAESLQTATHEACPGMFKPGEVDEVWLNRVVERQTLGGVRKRFLAQLVSGTAPPHEPDDAAQGGGDIDLF